MSTRTIHVQSCPLLKAGLTIAQYWGMTHETKAVLDVTRASHLHTLIWLCLAYPCAWDGVVYSDNILSAVELHVSQCIWHRHELTLSLHVSLQCEHLLSWLLFWSSLTVCVWVSLNSMHTVVVWLCCCLSYSHLTSVVRFLRGARSSVGHVAWGALAVYLAVYKGHVPLP